MTSIGAASDRPRPLLSIVIVTYECRELVLDCLGTLDGQRSDLATEVLVVDNQSTDGTLDAIAQAYPWTKRIAAGGNLGFARANNLAIKRCAGEFVLLLNPDTLLPAGSLLRCVSELQERPETGMLSCKLVQPDGSLDHACKRGFPTPRSSIFYFTKLHRLFPNDLRLTKYVAGHLSEDEVGYVDAVNGAFMLCRDEAVKQIGLIDERFWMYGEDLDWCFRFWEAGWKILYWPRVEVVHVKGGSSSAHRRWPTNFAFHRAMWIFHRKHYARRYSGVANGAVWTAVHLKLILSGLRSVVLRRMKTRTSSSGAA